MQALATMAKMTNFASIRQSIIKNSNNMAKEPFKSDVFEEIGEFGENSEDGENSPKPLRKVK